MQESIIVYRNPMEKLMWETIFQSHWFIFFLGIFFGILTGAIVVVNFLPPKLSKCVSECMLISMIFGGISGYWLTKLLVSL